MLHAQFLPAGDFDYTVAGSAYSTHRRTDARIAALIHDAIGDARTVVNVGAGTGSYEPMDRHVIAIEPSAAMRAQRPRHLVPAIDAAAESLPLDARSVDAAMATITVHQWKDLARGLSEMRRVSRGPVVIMAFDRDALGRFWLAEYSPELIEAERRRDPPIARIAELLGGDVEVRTVPIPIDCADGFTEAFYARPERFLTPSVRRAQSGWGFIPTGAEEQALAKLERDLKSGAWDRKHGRLRRQPFFEGSLRLIISR